MSLALVLSFAVLLVLLVLALLWSHWPAWLKALLVVGVSGFYFFGHEAVRDIWGIPTSEPLPARFVKSASM